ncbi:GNAT family N-acetyltransferase [Devriesea agamarum]|uniref:GNAT family N-acetyltransferase n=1 Tax=Devriesea agamarum TaxID=472569 RepID=UPI00071D9EBB|nr:GNAT family N-acetyltransferase [Devriesea agamarum]
MVEPIPLRLRPWRRKDAEELCRLCVSDPELERQFPSPLRTVRDARAWIERWALGVTPRATAAQDEGQYQDSARDRLILAVTHEHTGAVLGNVAVAYFDRHRNGWFSYWTAKEMRGRGVASRAATAFANYLLRLGIARRLELGYRANNPASAAVARHAGFVVEGREREKFVIDGDAVDVITCARLARDPWPHEPANVHIAALRSSVPTLGA